MRMYTYSEARQNFKRVLDRAQKDGEVLIRRRDGSTFVLRPVTDDRSPLDVPGVESDIGREEIVEILRELRAAS